MNRVLMAGALTCLLGAAALAGPAAGGTTGPVYAPQDCIKPAIEPQKITLTCADSGIRLKKLDWDEWNTPKVKGRGKLLVSDCDPDCVSGDVDRYGARVTLLNIKTYSCDGQQLAMYRRAHLRFPDRKPPNVKDLRSFQLSCNP